MCNILVYQDVMGDNFSKVDLDNDCNEDEQEKKRDEEMKKFTSRWKLYQMN